MLRSKLTIALCALLGGVAAVSVGAQTTDPAPQSAPAPPSSEVPPPPADTLATSPAVPPPAASAPIELPSTPPVSAPPQDEEASFRTFRHDLVNLLILSADGRLLAAAAQIAAPDEKDTTRSANKKTPGLLKRALSFAGKDPLVLWIAAANACLTKPGCADPAALTTLQSVDADNAGVWLRTLPADGNAAKAQQIVARMAQAQRYDDYWAADVVALYHALQALPVPPQVLQQGVGTDAARINFATSIASTILPAQLQQLGNFCRGAAGKDEALIGDCIAVARKLETGGTFISQKVGFAIEDALVAPGVNRDVMLARQRSGAWQQEKFLELSARFPREAAVAQSYVRLLGSEQNELAAVVALLREQSVRTDPPAGWQPAAARAAGDPLQTQPATQH